MEKKFSKTAKKNNKTKQNKQKTTRQKRNEKKTKMNEETLKSQMNRYYLREFRMLSKDKQLGTGKHELRSLTIAVTILFDIIIMKIEHKIIRIFEKNNSIFLVKLVSR